MCVVVACYSVIGLGLFVPHAEAQRPDSRSDTYWWEVIEFLEEALIPGTDIDIQIGAGKQRFSPGEEVDIRFVTSHNCHVNLMFVSMEGEITFVLPNHDAPHVVLEGNRAYSLRHDFHLPLHASGVGWDVVNIFCTSSALSLFETDFAHEQFYTISPYDDDRLASLMRHLQHLQAQPWSGKSLVLLTGGVKCPFSHIGALSVRESDYEFFPPVSLKKRVEPPNGQVSDDDE